METFINAAYVGFVVFWSLVVVKVGPSIWRSCTHTAIPCLGVCGGSRHYGECRP